MTWLFGKHRVIVINIILLGILATSSIAYLTSQEQPSAEPCLENLEYVHNYSSSPSVRVTGTIYNPRQSRIREVMLWVDLYVDYACAHHMDALLKTERIDIGTVEANSKVAFEHDIPYVNDQAYFFRYVKTHLDWQ